ncbi:MAG TPA: RidA family protein, partial [Caulobacteraceae bacterium]
MEILLPEGWRRPKGYADGIAAEGRLVFVAGQIGWNERREFAEKTFAGQFRQTLLNTLAVLSAGGARPEHVARMTWYVTDKQAYLGSLREVGAIWRELFGAWYPAMAV